MPGGLIDAVSYVSSDLYLTGSPQITFYRMVYRRYTNFAMESIYLDFDDNIKFGYKTELIPPRIADLMHKAYLHIRIPNIAITKSDVGIDMHDLQYVYLNKRIVTDYEKIRLVYMKVMTEIYRIVFKAVNASNVTYSGLIRDVYDYANSPGIQDILIAYDALLLETQQNILAENANGTGLNGPESLDVLRRIDLQQDSQVARNIALLDSRQSNLWYIITHSNISKYLAHAEHTIDPDRFEPNSDEYLKEVQHIMKSTIFRDIDRGFGFCKDVQNYFFNRYIEFTRQANDDRSQNIRCAWVKNLGHSIIEAIDVYIGGIKIDSHLGIWINLWYQLTYNYAQIEIYNEMIGNVETLTNFDNQEKPCYDIYVPLTFWFNKFNGLAFPLIAMQYNDVRFLVRLRRFPEVFYIEKLYRALLNGTEVVLTAEMIDFILNRSENKADLTLTHIQEVRDINLTDIWEDKGKQLLGHIMMDYVYLESPERKRFAQSGHEYLIERIQTNYFENLDQTYFERRLDFTQPSKEIMWVLNKDCTTQNPYGYTECKWYDHSLFFVDRGCCDRCYKDRDFGRLEGRVEAFDKDCCTNFYGRGNPVLDARLDFNNYVRISPQYGSYFDKLQPILYHHRTPSDGINIYSFCIDPLQHQPTGSCNFTRLTDVRLFLNIDNMYYRYTDAQIYPHDLDINFKIIINDPDALLEQIDIEFVKKTIREYKAASNRTDMSRHFTGSVVSADIIKRFEDANVTLFVYEQLAAGNTIEIYLDAYRRLLFKTKAMCHVFNLSMNVLRLIGGYGALAFSGNDF